MLLYVDDLLPFSSLLIGRQHPLAKASSPKGHKVNKENCSLPKPRFNF